MLDGLSFNFDGFSFFLGVIAVFLIWILFHQFRGWLPSIQVIINQSIKKFRERNFSGVDAALRRDALKRAQHAHLAAQLFSLDEILITPKIIAPPVNQDPNQLFHSEFVISGLFPNLPDWPEIPSQYPIDFITLSDSIQHGANTVLVGVSGSGKTVALAHLASLFARKDPSLGKLARLHPLYLHILDILPQFSQDLQGLLEPVNLLVRIISARLPIWVRGRFPAMIRKSFADGNALVLLDGLDELPSQNLKDALVIIQKIHVSIPHLRIITTSTPLNVGNFLRLGYQPITLAAWNREERQAFIESWGKAWNEKLIPKTQKKGRIKTETLDPVFVKSWINSNQLNLTPLEWTLTLWAVYSGEAIKLTSDQVVHAFVNRMVQDPQLLKPVFSLAVEMIAGEKVIFDQTELDAVIALNALSQIQLFDPTDATIGMVGSDSHIKKEKTFSSHQFLRKMAQTGILVEHPGQIYRFCHPVILGYCAAVHSENYYNDWVTDPEPWDTKSLALEFCFTQSPDSFIVSPNWFSEEPPLYRKLLLFSRNLKGIPVSHPIRAKMMRRMVDGLIDDRNLFGVRLCFASALAVTNESSVINYFQQLLSSPNAELRQIGCLMLGALQETKAIPDLATLLSDLEEKVRRNACCALGNMPDKSAIAILEDCLSANDEILRQAAAESLAANPVQGHEILHKLSQSENLLIRRSVVFGLARIVEPWAKDLIEQIAVKDSQWVVRIAASQALVSLLETHRIIPEPLSTASETAWIIAYAGRQGLGIQTGDPAINILINALQSGSPQERIAALSYLRLFPQEKVLQAVLRAVNQPDLALSEAAEFALWYLTCLKPDISKAFRTTIY